MEMTVLVRIRWCPGQLWDDNAAGRWASAPPDSGECMIDLEIRGSDQQQRGGFRKVHDRL
jgi:hypothetical protein